MQFSHYGKIGDIIYHLPVIRHLGGGQFYMVRSDTDGFRDPSGCYQSLVPLLEAIPFLESINWSDNPKGICFSGWRRVIDFSKNLTNQAASWLGMDDISPSCTPWLEVAPDRRAAVVISHSGRNFDQRFPWPEVLRKYGKEVVFVGLPHEHQWFVSQYGDVPHYETKDLLRLAEIVKGSKFFIGNPSAPLAIAEAMKHNCIAASFSGAGSCVFYHRPGHQHCWDQVDLWDI